MGHRDQQSLAYWRANLRAIALLLACWFVVGVVLSIVLVDPLNRVRLGGYPLGFWFAQQGSIYVFIALVFVYAKWMGRVDRRHAPPEVAADEVAGGPVPPAGRETRPANPERNDNGGTTP